MWKDCYLDKFRNETMKKRKDGTRDDNRQEWMIEDIRGSTFLRKRSIVSRNDPRKPPGKSI
jgi:hypothetical protein